MKKSNRLYYRKLVPVLAALVLAFGLSTAAYAANLGGIQRTVQVWIRGDQTNAVMEVENGQYSLTYQDENGKPATQFGGGIAIEPDGSERPLTEEELLAHLNEPDVIYEDDGSVKVYYYNQVLDITDKFVDGKCYVTLVTDGKPMYLFIKYNDGYSYSTNKYPDS